ncbi:uracil-DNA glycosylase [Cryobacterium sp. TMT2-18-3]|uniref:uracil-DNA glycosylase n=1 Tax=unclassified Cryobacterium TaxID=2649013 RepID=UPI00106C7F4A|nr:MULTISPECIES: uracil-DNA glycosylase [unclassified Cryobacterium]TFC29803.1 uracil-DNA glycosylase [Cryobacterium sp. TMT2-18-2]TFC61942.1 uracil-DNA glycosylase [Cryobacterium sp. TMT2-18-3]TFC63661.1 uracil-DNA glycosylase [Cryobacterium sp. TMT2-15-1]
MPVTLAALTESRAIDLGWAQALAPVASEIDRMGEHLRAETLAGRIWLPAPENVFRAFAEPFDAVRVLIVGQDPYPTRGHPIGLAFATEAHVRPLPRSLANICRELHDDVGVTAATGDLSPWSRRGVLLLNRVLTVQAGLAGSHRRRGWESVTEQAIRALVARDRPLVAILWGKDAGTLRPLLGDTPVIESAHPSPLSARRGFFGSKPFSRANEYLGRAGAAPVDWSLG